MPSQKELAKIIAKCWTDEKFKEEFKKNPEKILKQEGIEIPEGKKVKIIENDATTLHIFLPNKPSKELSEKELGAIAGGDWIDNFGLNDTCFICGANK